MFFLTLISIYTTQDIPQRLFYKFEDSIQSSTRLYYIDLSWAELITEA